MMLQSRGSSSSFVLFRVGLFCFFENAQARPPTAFHSVFLLVKRPRFSSSFVAIIKPVQSSKSPVENKPCDRNAANSYTEVLRERDPLILRNNSIHLVVTAPTKSEHIDQPSHRVLVSHFWQKPFKIWADASSWYRNLGIMQSFYERSTIRNKPVLLIARMMMRDSTTAKT